MATVNQEDEQARYARVPFSEAIDYFDQKINLDTDSYRDLSTSAQHDAAFVVAGAKGALLQDLRNEVDLAIREGKSREDFKREYRDIIRRRGWDTTNGSDWRAGIIYSTNVRQAYGEGRCLQMSDPDVQSARPFRMWVHGDSPNFRPEHLAMNGKVFSADHPVAQTKLPDGYGCRCTWVTLSKRDMARRGLSVETGINWGSVIETRKGPKTLAIAPGFGGTCRNESDQARRDRKAAARKGILDRIHPDHRRDATREIAIALGIVTVAGVAGYVGYEFLSDSVGATQAVVAIYQDIATVSGLRSQLPKKADKKIESLLNDRGFKEEVARNLYQNLEQLERDIQYEQAHPDYVEELKRRGVSTAEERFDYSMDLIGRQGMHDDYRYALGELNDSGIPPEELAALRWYTSTQGYKEMNGILRGKTDEVWEAVEKFKLFNGTKEEWIATVEKDVNMATNALNRLPGYKGKVYRGLELPQELIDGLKVGGDWVEDGFMSTTNNPFLRYPGNAVFVVNSKNSGKNIIPFERYANREILFAPGSKFKIRGKRLVKKFGQEFWLIEMDDMSPSINLLEKLNTKVAGSVVDQNETSRVWVDDQAEKNRPPQRKPTIKRKRKPKSVSLDNEDISEPQIQFDDLPDLTKDETRLLAGRFNKGLLAPGFDLPEQERVLVGRMGNVAPDKALTIRTSSDLVAPKDPILPPPPATRPAPPATLEVRKITEDELSALRQSAKRDLPFRLRINKNKNGTINVQPTIDDNYVWSPEQAGIVGNYLRSKGVYLSPSFDPNNKGWQEGANYLKVAFDVSMPLDTQPLGDLALQSPSQKYRGQAFTLQNSLEETNTKIESIQADRDRLLDNLARRLDTVEGNPLADSISANYGDQVKILQRRAKQQKARIQGLILDADRLDEYERRASTTYDIASIRQQSEGVAKADFIIDAEKVREVKADVEAAIARIPQAQKELDILQRIEDDLKLNKELLKSITDERKAVTKQRTELVKNIRVLEDDLNRKGEGLIGGRSGKTMEALQSAKADLAAIEIRLPELERAETGYQGAAETLKELLDPRKKSELQRQLKNDQSSVDEGIADLNKQLKALQKIDNLRSASPPEETGLAPIPKPVVIVPKPRKAPKPIEKRYVRRKYADDYATKIGGKVLVQQDENGKTIYVVAPPGENTVG